MFSIYFFYFPPYPLLSFSAPYNFSSVLTASTMIQDLFNFSPPLINIRSKNQTDYIECFFAFFFPIMLFFLIPLQKSLIHNEFSKSFLSMGFLLCGIYISFSKRLHRQQFCDWKRKVISLVLLFMRSVKLSCQNPRAVRGEKKKKEKECEDRL